VASFPTSVKSFTIKLPSQTVASAHVNELADEIVAIETSLLAQAPLNVLDFDAVGDGVADDTAAIQAVITAAAGRPVLIPPGTYVITATLTDVIATAGKNRGTVILGAGREKTIFDNRVAAGPMIRLDTGTNDKYQWGSRLQGFQIRTTTNPAASDGIYLRRQQHVTIDDVYITGLTGDGIEIELASGDADGSTFVTFRDCWISNCAAWGIHCNLAAGLNELSFLELDHVCIESCGTNSAAAPPTTGGMKWKGQVCLLRNSGFVTNFNTGLYVPGGAGASNELIGLGATFENNRGRQLIIETLATGLFLGTQFYNSDALTATHGADLSVTGGGANTKIKFLQTIVRATSGNNPYTAFTIDADCQDCVIEDTKWDVFDFAGQTRFSNASAAIGTRLIDDGILVSGTAQMTNATRGDYVFTNGRGIRGANTADTTTVPLIHLDASDHVVIGSTATRNFFPGPSQFEVVATASLPAAGATEDGRILIEDGGAGVKNLVLYAGGQRFRAGAGAAPF
jgi:hypothetical protein